MTNWKQLLESKHIRSLLIATGGLVLSYVHEVLTGVDLGGWHPLVVGLYSVGVNAVKEWARTLKSEQGE